jgi:nitrogen fixation protein FixH
MINAIGDAAMQQTVRVNYSNESQEQAVIAKKTEQIKEKRPVEKSDKSSDSELNQRQDENITAKNTFEDGRIVVEKYDEDGKLVRKIPPGYLPFGEMA